jgi:hypothetical protein
MPNSLAIILRGHCVKPRTTRLLYMAASAAATLALALPNSSHAAADLVDRSTTYEQRVAQVVELVRMGAVKRLHASSTLQHGRTATLSSARGGLPAGEVAALEASNIWWTHGEPQPGGTSSVNIYLNYAGHRPLTDILIKFSDAPCAQKGKSIYYDIAVESGQAVEAETVLISSPLRFPTDMFNSGSAGLYCLRVVAAR